MTIKEVLDLAKGNTAVTAIAACPVSPLEEVAFI